MIFAVAGGQDNVNSSHCLSFSYEDFLHITIINSVLCFVKGRTDLAGPTKLLVILAGQVKTTQQLNCLFDNCDELSIQQL